MIEPFDVEIFDNTYAIFPEEAGVYTVFKDGREYLQMQMDTERQWLKLDPDSGIPLFGLDEEVNAIGQAIAVHEQYSQ